MAALASAEVTVAMLGAFAAIAVAVVTAVVSYMNAKKTASLEHVVSIDKRVVDMQEHVERLEGKLTACECENDRIARENIRLMKMILKANGNTEI